MRVFLALALVTFGVACFPLGTVAHAQTVPAPGWQIHSVAMPTQLLMTREGHLVILVTNAVGVPTDGSTVTIVDTLPAGLEVMGRNAGGMSCENNTPVVTCIASSTITKAPAPRFR